MSVSTLLCVYSGQEVHELVISYSVLILLELDSIDDPVQAL